MTPEALDAIAAHRNLPQANGDFSCRCGVWGSHGWMGYALHLESDANRQALDELAALRSQRDTLAAAVDHLAMFGASLDLKTDDAIALARSIVEPEAQG